MTETRSRIDYAQCMDERGDGREYVARLSSAYYNVWLSQMIGRDRRISS